MVHHHRHTGAVRSRCCVLSLGFTSAGPYALSLGARSGQQKPPEQTYSCLVFLTHMACTGMHRAHTENIWDRFMPRRVSPFRVDSAVDPNCTQLLSSPAYYLRSSG